MLAGSLPAVGRAEMLEVQVSFQGEQNGAAGMLLSLEVSPADGDETLRQRLTTLTEGSASFGTARSAGPELTLMSAWQLALALGGSPSVETTADRKVRVQVSLPLRAASLPSLENEAPAVGAEARGVT
jgi:hypothetical protein